jgi:hypothetical protein
MANQNPGFEVIAGTDTEPRPPEDNKVAIALIMMGIKALSQRALTAVTDLFSLLTVASCFYLWYLTPKPDAYQIASLTLYGLLTLAINWIVRRK